MSAQKTRPQCIILTGFMGTGKSTVAQVLAEQLAWPYVDLDEEIERRVGKTITEIFADGGETAFRKQETLCLQECLQRAPLILATGGGAICRPENEALMHEAGFVVSLTAPVETLLARLKGNSDRPLLKVKDPHAEILRLIAERQAVYDRADYVLNTQDKNPTQVADAVQAAFRKWAIQSNDH